MSLRNRARSIPRRLVLSYANLPPRLPITSTGVAVLFLLHFDPETWVWWLVGALMGLLWLIRLTMLGMTRQVDIFNPKGWRKE